MTNSAILFTYVESPVIWNSFLPVDIISYVPVHSLGATHSFLASSKNVPFGHSHPLIAQISGQAMGSVLPHLRVQLGCAAHGFLTCPLIGQTV